MNLSTTKWVSALHSTSLGLNTLPCCVGLADLHGDGDYKLVIGDYGTEKYNIRLKVFKGIQLIGESVLSDLPAAVAPFINEHVQPSSPSIAVACGASILIYKNLKPFYKFTPPSLEINPVEAEAWHHLEAGHIDTTQLHAVLLKLLHEVQDTYSQTTLGLYDVDYRIFVSDRNAEIFRIKRDVTSIPGPIITMKSDILGLARVGKQLAVACADQTITFFTAKGKRQNKMQLSEPIQGIDTFTYEPKQYVALLVALEKEVRIYCETNLVDRQKVDQPISWIRFGQFGREEGALIIGTKSKETVGPPQAQNRKLNIPRRTKIYVDQAVREREHAQLMHQVFQRDLFMLRLAVTKAFANLMQNSLSSISTKKHEAVEISVEINGFGPIFRMIIKLRAASQPPLQHHWLTFHYNQEWYQFENSLIPVPALVSGMAYEFTTIVRCLCPENGISDDVRVLLVGQEKVIVAALVTMPVSEMSLLD
ncbi:unnamed protein product [Gongylonema pulchrum]|uniref:BBS1 domain-containing protein n=1 Tax=Gongylonema pulchrum TaxID=637853 RepID=A0A183DQH7_9BILA|nr:unnamed protein product [Gongylonema pulchrum]